MAIFGCDFTQFFDRHVAIPEIGDEITLFTEFHQQKKPLVLKDKGFEFDLIMAIKDVQKMIDKEKIVKPKTKAEKTYN